MTAMVMPEEDELYLLALLDDPSGLDLAEFAWIDEENDDGCFRAWDVQWKWYSDESTFQVDQCGRSVGKTNGIVMRAFAFPFVYPGQEMLITAPELNHLRPLVDQIEFRITATRLSNEMRPRDKKGGGISRQPHWQVRFANGARIMSRLPGRDGRGVKGCMVAGTLITTRRGQVPIEEIGAGEEVLTHEGRWRPVECNYHYTNADGYVVRGGGHRGLAMSEAHRMWGRRNRNPQRKRNLESPTWVIAADEELAERYYLGSPTRFPAEPLPEMPHPDYDALMTLAGMYVADGDVPRPTTVSITDDRDDADRIAAVMAELDLSVGRYPKDSRAVRVDGQGARDVAAFLVTHFGRRAAGKHLPPWLLGAEERLRKAFLLAYLAGDGYWDEAKQRWTASTASKALAIDLRLLAQTLGYSASYSWVDPAPNAMAPQPYRAHRVTISCHDGAAIVEGGVAWRKVRAAEAVTGLDVYDLCVDDDHSYVADGLVSHNQHPIILEADEMQDYPLAGWTELTETLKRGSKGAQWRAHGVSRGVRDKFYEITQDDSNWQVHRIMAMHRESWGPNERDEKIKQYGGSRQNPDYKRNIYGEHGDATNPVFVLARLMACVDQNEGTEFNTDVYHFARISYEQLQSEDNPTGQPIEAFLQIPGTHKKGHEIAPKGYSAYYAGMDVGVTNHPSEILLFGQRAGKSADAEHLDLLLRIQMLRVDTGDQIEVVEHLFSFYGAKLLAFGIDSTGLGFPVMQALNRKPFGSRIHGYNASEKVTVGVRDPEEGEENLDPEDLAEERNVIEYATDALRNDYVDPRRLTLPFDREVLTEWQAQNYTVVKGEGSPYGKRKKFSEGEFHTLDAARMMAAAKALPAIAEQLKPVDPDPVLDVFVGSM